MAAWPKVAQWISGALHIGTVEDAGCPQDCSLEMVRYIGCCTHIQLLVDMCQLSGT